MAKIVERLVELEVDYVNAYTLAGDELRQAIRIAEGSKTKVLGITVLTHYSDDYCRNTFQLSLSRTVKWLAKRLLG